jgi:hypothetical protein
VFPVVNSGKHRITAVGREFTAVERSNKFVTAALVGKEVNYFHFYQQALMNILLNLHFFDSSELILVYLFLC